MAQKTKFRRYRSGLLWKSHGLSEQKANRTMCTSTKFELRHQVVNILLSDHLIAKIVTHAGVKGVANGLRPWGGSRYG